MALRDQEAPDPFAELKAREAAKKEEERSTARRKRDEAAAEKDIDAELRAMKAKLGKK